MRIAYQGEPGAYSEAAALRFSPHAETIPCESFDEVFAQVQSGKATHGILPIENSIGGSIHRNYDLLLEHELPVVAEVLLQVSHNLLAYPGTAMKDITKVYSHPQGLAQCEGFLSSLKGIVWVGVALFIFGIASLAWPPLRVIIGSVTTSMAIMGGGLALMVWREAHT